MRTARSLAMAALAALALPAAARAQAFASVGVEAVVSTTALSIGQMQDLRFGNVVAGVPVTINPRTNVNAGMWEIHGNRNAEFGVQIALPTELSTGFWTMPISFNNQSGCWRRQPGQNACTQYDPSTVLVERIRNNVAPNNVFYVWIGGTVSPSATQHTGVYLGNLTLSVAYTGN